MSNSRRHDLEIKPNQLEGMSAEFGEALNERLRRIAEALESHSGLRGPVHIAKQKKYEQTAGREAITEAGMQLRANRIADLADPIDNQDAATKKWVLDLLTCRHLSSILSRCQEAEDLIDDAGSDGDDACESIHFSNQHRIDTGFTSVRAICSLNEFVYVFGLLSGAPTLNVYRQSYDNFQFELVGTETISNSIDVAHCFMDGRYIYYSGYEVGGTTPKWGRVDLLYPDFPISTGSGSLGTGPSFGAPYVQGRFVFIPGTAKIYIIDISGAYWEPAGFAQ